MDKELHSALEKGNLNAARRALREGAAARYLWQAVEWDDPGIVRDLAARGAEPGRCEGGSMPLSRAVKAGHALATEALLAAGADPNGSCRVHCKSVRSTPPLCMVDGLNAPTIARILLAAGADPNAVDPHTGWSPLQFAVHRRHPRLLRVLVLAPGLAAPPGLLETACDLVQSGGCRMATIRPRRLSSTDARPNYSLTNAPWLITLGVDNCDPAIVAEGARAARGDRAVLEKGLTEATSLADLEAVRVLAAAVTAAGGDVGGALAFVQWGRAGCSSVLATLLEFGADVDRVPPKAAHAAPRAAIRMLVSAHACSAACAEKTCLRTHEYDIGLFADCWRGERGGVDVEALFGDIKNEAA